MPGEDLHPSDYARFQAHAFRPYGTWMCVNKSRGREKLTVFYNLLVRLS